MDLYLSKWLKIVFTNKIVFFNIIGNVVIFMPLPVYIRNLVKKDLIVLLSLVIIVCFEVLQFVLQVGVLDINDIILDVIGYKYEVVPLWPAHTLGYYQNGAMCLEFFADTFASLMLNKQKSLDSINRLLPKSYNSFCELLDKIYDKTMMACS